MKDQTAQIIGGHTYPSIAILPFINRSFSSENDYLGDGIAEGIINALSQVEGLKVVARTSSFAYKNKQVDIREIGEKLGVSCVLEGSIRMSRNSVRVIAQLVNVKDGFHIWSDTFDCSLADVDVLQDDISRLISDKLQENLGHIKVDEKIGLKPRLGMSAYQGYLKARHSIQKMNKKSIEYGISILERVIEMQPGFSLPYLELHYAYSSLSSIGVMTAKEAENKSEAYLETALKLDPELPECQNQLARVSLWKLWDLNSVYRHLNKAIKQRPGYADAYQTLCLALLLERKVNAAMNAVNKALELDPLSAHNHYMKAYVLFVQENYDHAIVQAEESLMIEPNYLYAHLMIVRSLVMSGNEKEGMIRMKQIAMVIENEDVILGMMTWIQLKQGFRQTAQEGIVQLEAKLDMEPRSEVLFFLMLIYAEAGELDKAMDLIRFGQASKSSAVLLFYAEPVLKPYHGQPAFQELLDEILKKPAQYEASTAKYRKSSLREEDIDLYYEKLQQLMMTEKPFLDRQLTLRLLAQKIDIHPNHLSQLLNDRIGCNFAEYVNAYRLRSFKKKAEDPANQQLTLLALAFESGFNSKTVFNTYFKRTTGQTPSEYWREVKPRNMTEQTYL